MPDPQVIDDWLRSSSIYSHIFIDGTRYRPEVNEVLISKSDLILIPITSVTMDRPGLDLLMNQIAAKRSLEAAPVMLVFNQRLANDVEIERYLRRIETCYGRAFPCVGLTQRKVFCESEDRTLRGPLMSPVLTPELEMLEKHVRS